MPPRVKINREMIIDAAFDIVKNDGIEKMSARTISERLKCSTQPIFYHFASIEEIKKSVYEKADMYHSEYIMPKGTENVFPLMELGLNYIRFGYEEKKLFQFLFQTNQFGGYSLEQLIERAELSEMLHTVSMGTVCDETEAKELFLNLFIVAHGCASLLANNAIEYAEARFDKILENVFNNFMQLSE
jgi:AcrR family transcriptional regulator